MTTGPRDGGVNVMSAEKPVKTPRPSGSRAIHTIGHSTLTLDAFVERLQRARMRGLADVRRFPASRRHPQFGRTALAESLAARGLEYRWFEALGGRRAPGPLEGSPNAGLRVEAFRAYADYALTGPFREAFADLRTWAESLPVAICCAEALWWQCHRRILADHLVARDWRVLHILSDGRVAPHELWDLARPSDGAVTYPAVQPNLFGAGELEGDAG